MFLRERKRETERERERERERSFKYLIDNGKLYRPVTTTWKTMNKK